MSSKKCHKKCFYSKEEARGVKKCMLRKKHKIMRIYWCEEHKAYHLTKAHAETIHKEIA